MMNSLKGLGPRIVASEFWARADRSKLIVIDFLNLIYWCTMEDTVIFELSYLSEYGKCLTMAVKCKTSDVPSIEEKVENLAKEVRNVMFVTSVNNELKNIYNEISSIIWSTHFEYCSSLTCDVERFYDCLERLIKYPSRYGRERLDGLSNELRKKQMLVDSTNEDT